MKLYIDGQNVGEAAVELSPGTIRFTDLQGLGRLLPPLRQEERLMAALQQPLPDNVGLSCLPRPIQGCGLLHPVIVGVILSRDADRIDLFLAQSVRGSPRTHLPDPSAGAPTVAGSLDLQYGLSRTGLTYALRQRSVTGFGRTQLAIDTLFANHFSRLDSAYLRRVGDRISLTAGLFPSNHYSFMFLDRFLGVSLATTNDTRLDRDTINDTPLVIDISLSGRVEIYRDGVLIDTQPLMPGRIMLDTSRFPAGIYPITLKIIDASGERTETRLFAREAALPSLGQTQYFIEAGANVPFGATAAGFLPDILSPALRAGAAWRFSPRTAFNGRIEASSNRQLLELGATYLANSWRASTTAAIAASGERAVALTLSGSIARISWSLDARGVQGASDLLVDPERGLGRTYRQITAFGGWTGRTLSLSTGLFWRKDLESRSSWALLPRLLWTISQGSGRVWQLDASGSVGRSEWTVRVGIRAALFGGGRPNITLFGGAEARMQNGATQVSPVGRADLQDSLTWGVDSLAVRAALSREAERTSGEVGGDWTDPRFQLTADATIDEQLRSSVVFGRASTQFGFVDGHLAFGSNGFTGAGIIAEVPGASDDARFAVRTGNSSSRPFAGEGPVFVSTRPFSEGSIGINALGSGSAIDTRAEPVVFYPGTVKRLVRKSTTTVVIFGRLVDETGSPLASATVDGGTSSTETDEKGNFQIEASSSVLTVHNASKGDCSVMLPEGDLRGRFTDAGVLTCRR